MSLKSLKKRVAKLEELWGRQRGGALIMIYPGETQEMAWERYYREHPQADPDPRRTITFDFRDGEDPETLGGDHPPEPSRENQAPGALGPGAAAGALAGDRSGKEGSHRSQAVQIDDRDAGEESPWPHKLDKNLPFDAWMGFFAKKGSGFEGIPLNRSIPRRPCRCNPKNWISGTAGPPLSGGG